MRTTIKRLFGRQDPAWWADAPRIFRDGKGNWYRRYEDEMKLPIKRMERLHIIAREIGNRVDDGDLSAFLENHESIILSDKTADEKLKLLHQHTVNLKQRTDLLAPPELLMRLVCATYIREDQDPCVWDEALEDEKHAQLMRDQAGGLADFFYTAGLSGYLPSPSSLRSGTEKLLKKSQELAELGRKQEKELGEALRS